MFVRLNENGGDRHTLEYLLDAAIVSHLRTLGHSIVSYEDADVVILRNRRRVLQAIKEGRRVIEVLPDHGRPLGNAIEGPPQGGPFVSFKTYRSSLVSSVLTFDVFLAQLAPMIEELMGVPPVWPLE
jgi:hypothetical protein